MLDQRYLMNALALLLGLAVVIVSACGDAAVQAPSPSPTPTPVLPPTLAVDAADGTFTGPDTVAAGWIKLSAANLKPRANCGLFVRLNDGITASAFSETIKAGPTPQVQAMVSFEGSVPPATPAELYLRARPGQHAFLCFVPVESTPTAVETAAYHVAREALANVVRHAEATWCAVRLRRGGDGALVLEVEDDGKGVAPGTPSGLGFESMRERPAEVGGHCLIADRSAGGTHVTAVFPFGGAA